MSSYANNGCIGHGFFDRGDHGEGRRIDELTTTIMISTTLRMPSADSRRID